MGVQTSGNRTVGYAYLIEKYRMTTLPNWHFSFIGQSGTRHISQEDGHVKSVYPLSYWPGDTTGDNLEFALKYDGTNPEILLSLFDVIPEEEISEWINSKPTGKYARRIWYLYEFLTGKKLPLSDLKQGNYVELLESDQYFTIKPGQRVQRQRIIDNLLGGRLFCPIIRRSKKLAAMEAIDLHQRCEEIVTPYPQELLKRALAYLYTKETKSSFEIEHITPSPSRTEKFVELLKMAEHRDYCEKLLLIDIQNRIADSRFQENDYRENQNYVGQTISFQNGIFRSMTDLITMPVLA